MSHIRDVDADYRTAYIAEYESYKRAGLDEQAENVAQILRDGYGHEVEPKSKRQTAKRASAPERADQKAPEEAVPPKPSHSED